MGGGSGEPQSDTSDGKLLVGQKSTDKTVYHPTVLVVDVFGTVREVIDGA